MQYTTKELKEILNKHRKWMSGDPDEKRANLYGANLRGADLYGADLRGANLYGADLREADLYGANLYGANLRGANLYGADLRGADLREANLYGANLRGADLREADLREANLYGANLRGADLYGAKIELRLIDKFFPICCPDAGAFIGWKKANGKIVKLEIQEDAKRSSAYGRKCRCSAAKCIGIENIDGTDSGLTEIASDYDHNFIYKVGEVISVPDFDEDRRNECTKGIHFFITRQEAVNY